MYQAVTAQFQANEQDELETLSAHYRQVRFFALFKHVPEYRFLCAEFTSVGGNGDTFIKNTFKKGLPLHYRELLIMLVRQAILEQSFEYPYQRVENEDQEECVGIAQSRTPETFSLHN